MKRFFFCFFSFFGMFLLNASLRQIDPSLKQVDLLKTPESMRRAVQAAFLIVNKIEAAFFNISEEEGLELKNYKFKDLSDFDIGIEFLNLKQTIAETINDEIKWAKKPKLRSYLGILLLSSAVIYSTYRLVKKIAKKLGGNRKVPPPL